MGSEEPAADAEPREPTRRLFFALWPDEAMRQAMVQAARKAARASGGRPVPAVNLHVTLAFLGSVPERRLAELAAVAREVADGLRSQVADADDAMASGGALELPFDRLEYWRSAHLLCALPAEPPALLAVLARRLQERLAARSFAPDLKPFRPHVTVVRKVLSPGPVGKMHPVAWRFTDFALVESRTLPQGALYSVVESYALCSGRKSANNSETS